MWVKHWQEMGEMNERLPSSPCNANQISDLITRFGSHQPSSCSRPSLRIPSVSSSKSNSSPESSSNDPGIMRVPPVVLLTLIGLFLTVIRGEPIALHVRQQWKRQKTPKRVHKKY